MLIPFCGGNVIISVSPRGDPLLLRYYPFELNLVPPAWIHIKHTPWAFVWMLTRALTEPSSDVLSPPPRRDLTRSTFSCGPAGPRHVCSLKRAGRFGWGGDSEVLDQVSHRPIGVVELLRVEFLRQKTMRPHERQSRAQADDEECFRLGEDIIKPDRRPVNAAIKLNI